MIEEVMKNLYKIVLPLPTAFLGSVNVYIAKGLHRNLLIDTGLQVDKCMAAMFDGLEKLDVDLHRTDFFITHYHPDHFGLLSRLQTEGSVVYINKLDVTSIERIESQAMFDDTAHFLEIAGFPEKNAWEIMSSDAGKHYRRSRPWSFVFVNDGDVLSVGDFRFRCIWTPGHSKGHMCLWEPEKAFFISGDHLLGDITPSIQLRNDIDNPLQDYLNTLETLPLLNVALVLPGHRPIFTNFRERIKQVKKHHKNRCNEILALLAGSGKTTYQVASQITWRIAKYNSWNTIPVLQRIFATGETKAHLKYLQEKGKIKKHMKGPVIIYSLAGHGLR